MIPNSIYSNKKVFWSSIGLFAFMILFILPILIDVEGGTAKNKITWFSKINIQKLGTALLQYSQDHEQMFPKNLEELTTQYLDSKALLSPINQQPYIYVAGFENDLPHHVPILVEKVASHLDARGNKYALVIYGDFQTEFIRQEHHTFLMRYIESLQKILQEKDGKTLLNQLKKELEYSKNTYITNTLIWKLAKIKYLPALSTIRKCQRLKHPVEKSQVPPKQYIYYQAKSVALSANYALHAMKQNYDKSFVQLFLSSDNYFHRKRAWVVLHPEKTMTMAISPSHVDQTK